MTIICRQSPPLPQQQPQEQEERLSVNTAESQSQTETQVDAELDVDVIDYSHIKKIGRGQTIAWQEFTEDFHMSTPEYESVK